MRVIGTAGHVDHGKSTLVLHLTGIDPDRLQEEKDRSLTIDLGFAWMPLENGEVLGIIDVPGHRDFIENMLSGVGGIAAVILVIAADEGVMPQTREHLAIIDLLGIPGGIIALTKIDLINDSDWLELVQLDIEDTVTSTVLQNAPIIPVSAHTGEGIEILRQAVSNILGSLPQTPDLGKPRLSADRVFTISGFGTVLTGTLLGGSLNVGDEIELYPGQLNGRIRGLQSYGESVKTALPGSRVAINISGIDKDQIQRGHLLTYPGLLTETRLVDAHYRHLADTSFQLKHNAEVKLFVGAAEVMARVRLLDSEIVAPGETGWIQLRLTKPLALARGDRFILRIPSPATTVGGGVIVDPHAAKRWKRFQNPVINRLNTLLAGTPAEQVAQAAESRDFLSHSELLSRAQMEQSTFELALDDAINEKLIVALDNTHFIATPSLIQLNTAMIAALRSFHEENPLRAGISKEELRVRINVKPKTLNRILSLSPDVIARDDIVHLADHKVTFTAKQEQTIRALNAALLENPFSPLTFQESVKLVGEELLLALIDLGEIVRVQSDIIFAVEAFNSLLNGTLELIEKNGSVDAKSLRDAFNTSRKYAIGLLEYLDAKGITRRVGDARVAGPKRDGEKK